MKHLRYVLITVVLAGFFAFSWFGRFQPVSLDLEAPSVINVEVKGQVESPGVYEIANGSTINDLLEKAGGTLEEADTSAISLNSKLADAQVVVVPEITDATASLVSINSADAEQLQQLPGIGPSMAQRIIDYREESPFTSLEQLKEVKGIGDKTFEKLKDLIAL